jgi:NTE family protein
MPRRAFVFGGGGVLGFAWMIGALTAVQHEVGIQPREDDLLVGTSAGAVMAALLSCNVPIDTIRRHQLGMPLPNDPPIAWDYGAERGGALPPMPGWRPGSPRLLWGGIRRPSAVSPVVALSGLLPRGRGSLSPIYGMIDALLDESMPSASWPQRRTWIVVTDYSSGGRVVFGREGAPDARLADAVCASCSIPAWYPPVEIGGRTYIDGGTVSNTSVDLLSADDFDEVVVLAPMAAIEPDSPRSPVAMIERRVRRSITRSITIDIDQLREAGVSVLLLTPGSEDLAVMGANLMNPARRLEVLHTALRTAAADLRRQRAEVGDSSAGTA